MSFIRLSHSVEVGSRPEAGLERDNTGGVEKIAPDNPGEGVADKRIGEEEAFGVCSNELAVEFMTGEEDMSDDEEATGEEKEGIRDRTVKADDENALTAGRLRCGVDGEDATLLAMGIAADE